MWSVIVETWLLLACQWDGFTPMPINCKDRLQPSTTELWPPTSNHCWRSTVQDPTRQSWTYFNGALVPAKCVSYGGVWVVKLWHGLKLLLGALALGPPRRCRPRSSATYILLWTTWHELQSDHAGGCYLCWAWGHLMRGIGHTDAKCFLFYRFLPPREIWSMSCNKPFIWKSHWKNSLGSPESWVE